MAAFGGVDFAVFPKVLFPLKIVAAGTYLKVELGYAQVHLGVSHKGEAFVCLDLGLIGD